MCRDVRLLFVPLCLLAAGCGGGRAEPSAASPPAVPVSVARAVVESVPSELSVVGTAEASAIVEVKSQAAGELTQVLFTEGQNVAKGDLLFRIDPRQYQDALRQAEAAVSRDRAQIAQAEATLARESAQAAYAETDAARFAELQKAGVISRSQYDQSRTAANVARETARAAQASIESAKAALESDQAAVASAKLNLSYCEIRAPIAGRTGNLLVHSGNLVKVNDAPLVVIHRIAPIFVNFNVPEDRLAAIRRLHAARRLAVQAVAQDGSGRSASGALTVIDNTVDPSTGTIRLKAAFENREGVLWPGQFVTVRLTLDTTQNATVIPSVAVQPGQTGQFVYAVKADKTVENRPVTVARITDGKAVIESGVAPGDVVVTDGHLRLFPGAKIREVDPAKLETGPI